MEYDDRTDNTKKIVASIVVLLAVVLVTVGVNALSSKKPESVAATTSGAATTNTSNMTAASAAESTSSSQVYKDGTYAATGNYSSPGGTQAIKISITIQNNAVIATSADGLANDRDAEVYQQSFIDGYKSLVIGKKLDSISLSRVSGSSLTSNGFNNALKQIKNEAKA